MWIRENIQYLVFVVMIGGVITAPMYYTRNGDDAFEPGKFDRHRSFWTFHFSPITLKETPLSLFCWFSFKFDIFCEKFHHIELVPVSSTVIPIASHSINATDDAQNLHSPSLDEEYRMAYIKLLHRNVSRTVDDSDTFITRKFKKNISSSMQNSLDSLT